MSGHRVEWRHDRDVVRGRIICEADEWAECRIYCSDPHCESWSPANLSDDHRTHEDDTLSPIGTVTHRMAAGSTCNYVEWVNDVSVEECYGGKDEPVQDGPVTFHWNGDDWLWAYAVEPS